MLPLTGYVSRLSARPGDNVTFHLSNATGVPVDASLVRVICADANPAGPGIREEKLDIELPSLSVDSHPIDQGSYGRVDLGGSFDALTGDFTLVLSVKPTRFSPDTTAAARVLEINGDDPALGLDLSIGHDGALLFGLNGVQLKTDPVAINEWYDIALSFTKATGAMSLRLRAVRHARHDANWRTWQHQYDGPASTSVLTQAKLYIGVATRAGFCCFDGRIEDPHLYARALSEAEIDATRSAEATTAGAVFAYDFSQDTASDRIVDAGPNGFDGQLVNHPTRAVRASRWSGREMCFRYAPHEYSAIHFHSDDLTDCCWPAALDWQVPQGLASGCYALRIKAGDAEDNIPFFVVPHKGKPTAKIAVLVSTFTYTIYANHARPEYRLSKRWRESWHDQTARWGAYPHNPGQHPEYALSTYNDHVDGSGISISSWSRPMLNVRVGYITYQFDEIRGSGLRHYPADTHLHTWLEDQGYDFDIITDQELHNEGLDLLRDYAVVLTGSHPEYHTRAMLDALTIYRDQGGRLMYLGGNGFYWKIALDPALDGVIEIRRGEGGIRAWAAEPGEYYNQFDGEYGGLWRRNGRPPQDLCGVGFSAQGNFVGSHYNLAENARTSRAAWMLDGVETDEFGGHGLSGHGAAGFELDRADKALGTPAHAVILATSEGHEPEAPWVLVPEERLTHLTTIPGKSETELIHADIVFFETPHNGAVFSTGSITYCGSLLTNGGDNDIATLTRNVLNRFADPQVEFPMPTLSQT